MRAVCAVLAVSAGCGFSVSAGPGGNGPNDGGPDTPSVVDAPDAPPPFVPVHVPDGGLATGTGDLVLTAEVDTGALTIGGSSTLPAGVSFDQWPQAGGPALAVLHVRALTVPSGTTVRVRGTHALVVVAAGDIAIDGTLDGGARLDVPGPGGAPPDMGDGKGNPGAHVQTFRDSGGSGAGFASMGGLGGGATGCNPSAGTVAGGGTYGMPTLPVLLGGSGGGAAFAASCGRRPGGAGGGAIQLSSATRVIVSGGITVGGGGGGGGPSWGSAQNCNIAAGSGGGSGGSIYLQAPRIDVTGTLAANGGGGGAGGGDPDGNGGDPGNDGPPGQDGQLGTASATPGADVGIWSAAGGGGGSRNLPAGGGATNNDCDGNGGGGGGSVGRIVIAVPATGTNAFAGTDSPAHVATTY